MIFGSKMMQGKNPSSELVHELVEEQAARTPDAIAMSCGGTHLTYRELNTMADAVAQRLRTNGVGPEAIVAICMERSSAMVAGVLGILKSGAAYLPLDPSYPVERLALMLQDSGTRLVLTENKFRGTVFDENVHTLCFDGENFSGENGTESASIFSAATTCANHPAYVIYTSGSTGKPKGVLMPHGALVNLLTWQLAELPGVRRTLQFASLSFDVSFQEIFSTWAAGGEVVLIGEALRRDPEALWNFIVRKKIERLFLPFVALQQLAGAACGAQAPDLREIITAGEQLRITPGIANFFENNYACVLHNHYGPTETHVVTAFSLRGSPRDWPTLPPIGKPIANVAIHILDEKLFPAAGQEPGAIFVAGACLARGYLNRPDIDAERFIWHAGTRLYKTGDIGRFLPDGDIEFLGRDDDQVKVRGHRIELTEIEAVLQRHAFVSQCVVAATGDGSAGRRLIAYVVPAPGATMKGSDDLSDFLRREMPDYMIPSAFALLDSLPLTPSGKIDRRSLPAPGDTKFRPMPRTQACEYFLAPTNGVEAELVRIWEEKLDVRPIGIRENFFDLGGHSLLAAEVSREITKKFGTPVSLMTIFHAPTVEKLAAALSSPASAEENPSLEKIRITGSRAPFFCIPGLFDLAHHMGAEQPFYGLNLPELSGSPSEWPGVGEIAADCIRAMRSVQPGGPYSVGGYSFGGVVAFEIARQLQVAGEKIALLALIDPDPPQPFRTSGLGFYFSRLIFHGQKIARLSLQKNAAYFADRLRNKKSRGESLLWNHGDYDPETATYFVRAEMIHARFQPAKFSGAATLFLASDTVWRARPDNDPRLGWRGFVGGEMEMHETPGDHATVIREPNVRALAQRLSTCLEKIHTFIALIFCMSAITI